MKTKTTHTPGPWMVDGQYIFGANGDKVIDMTGAMGGNDTKADERLITAAPDLLGQVKLLADFVEKHCKPGPGLNDILIHADAVIAKAKGGK